MATQRQLQESAIRKIIRKISLTELMEPISDIKFKKYYPKAKINGNFATTFPLHGTMWGLWKKYETGWVLIKGVVDYPRAESWLKYGVD